MKIRYVIFLMMVLCIGNVTADVLFDDDFEGGAIDDAKWAAQGTWLVVDNADGHDVLGGKVLDVWGGDVGLSVDDFPEEFDYYADFKTMDAGLTGFVFHGTDGNNIYMHQVSTAGSGHTPQHIRWHRRINGAWAAEPGAFEDGVDREQDVWYRIKFEVRKHEFKAYIGPVGGGIGELTLVSEWTDSESAHSEGKIGFRMSGGDRAGEHAQYDNIVVVTPDFDPTPVEPRGKLAITWGNLKIQ